VNEVRVTIKPRSEIDVEKLALALLAIAESLPPTEQDRLAAEGAVIAEQLDLYPKKSKKRKGSAA
jgi:hypothetical protein